MVGVTRGWRDHAPQRDIAFGTVFDVAGTVYQLSRLDGVDLDSVTVDSRVTEDTSVSRVTEVERRVGGRWSSLGRGDRVAAGDTLQLRATIVSSGGSSRTERYALRVPRGTAGHEAYLVVGSGDRSYGRSGRTLQKLLAGLEDRVRNDQVSATLLTFRRRLQTQAQAVGEPGDEVVRGGQGVELRITR